MKHDAANLAGFDPVRNDEAKYQARICADDARAETIENRSKEIADGLTFGADSFAYSLALYDELFSLNKDEEKEATAAIDKAVQHIGAAFRRMSDDETLAQCARDLGKLIDRHIERAALKRAEAEAKAATKAF